MHFYPQALGLDDTIPSYEFILYTLGDFKQIDEHFIPDTIARKEDIPTVNLDAYALKSEIPSVAGLASENYVDTKVADLVNSAPETLDTLGEVAAAIQQNEGIVEALNAAIGNKADKEHNHDDIYYTQTQVDEKISAINVPTNISAFTNDAGYLTTIPAEYITETELNAKGYLTQHQSLEEYAKKSEVPSVEGLASEEYVNTKFDELFQNVSSGKELIASAITDKGVYASDDETFQELSDKIGQIIVGPPGTNIIGYVDEENDIYVSQSELENGTYTLKFEDNVGLLDDFYDIGTVEVK